VEALMSIKEALNDPHGVLSNWDEFSVDPCSWPMITCSSDYFVIGLLVLLLFFPFYPFHFHHSFFFFFKYLIYFCRGAPSQNLSGTLSSAIANLTNLKQVLVTSLHSHLSFSSFPSVSFLYLIITSLTTLFLSFCLLFVTVILVCN
jgi:hypothetical protein